MQLISTATILMKCVLLLFAYVVNLRIVEINLKLETGRQAKLCRLRISLKCVSSILH